ncbi:HNH endonuclease [Candidatus Gracilibacteria bacterium]|nr:HNH endonuclease [Candidatus Gracilibacteria bacterium]
MKLHEEFVQLGRARRKLTNAMLAILPEIFRSGIWRKYADSIVEYAGKFGGLAPSAVRKRLGLDLSTKPLLAEAIREIGVHKAAIINSVTTVENQEEMVRVAKSLNKSSLMTFVKDIKGEVRVDLSVDMDEETEFMFRKLQEKFEGHSNKLALKNMMRQLFAEHFPQQKTRKVQKSTVTRHIPASKKREIGDKCALCHKPAKEFHHVVPWKDSHSHDSLIPLCKEHHQIQHIDDLLYQKYRLKRGDILSINSGCFEIKEGKLSQKSPANGGRDFPPCS